MTEYKCVNMACYSIGEGLQSLRSPALLQLEHRKWSLQTSALLRTPTPLLEVYPKKMFQQDERHLSSDNLLTYCFLGEQNSAIRKSEPVHIVNKNKNKNNMQLKTKYRLL